MIKCTNTIRTDGHQGSCHRALPRVKRCAPTHPDTHTHTHTPTHSDTHGAEKRLIKTEHAVFKSVAIDKEIKGTGRRTGEPEEAGGGWRRRPEEEEEEEDRALFLLFK